MSRRLMIVASFGLVLALFLAGQVKAADPAMVAFWKLDDGAGTTAVDSSGNGNNGTLAGNPKWGAGKLGGALDFDGNGDYVDCGNAQIFSITDAFALTVWINWRTRTGDWQTIIAKGDNTWRLARNGGGTTVDFGFTDGGARGWLSVATAKDVPLNEWHHVAATIDKIEGAKIYLDGVLDGTNTDKGGITTGGTNYPVRIGENAQATGRYWNGLIDDVRIYKRVLSVEEIKAVMAGAGAEYPFASNPTPADGALHADTWVTLSWKGGDFAVSHDVYLGDSFADVNAGAAATFRGNQASTYYVAGFPGFAYPDGLVPGTTYYWRIDEVNKADPNSPWKGPVWSFMVPPKKAYNPSPANGSKFMALDTTLSWTAGFGTKLHSVYFGENRDTVANATGAPPQALTTYKPAALKAQTTYYWRVDEFDGAATHKGDVWSFSTAKVGGGVKGQYFKGMNFDNLVLTRVDPQINFNWGDPGGPDPAVGNDQFSARWTGEVEAAFTETYTFYARADDGVRLWVDGKQLVNSWIDQGPTEYSGKVDLVAGNTYSIQMEYYENGGGAVAELRWESPHTPKQFVPQAALSPPVKANGPNPGNGATGVSLTPVLTWGPGDFAASHEVYFGTAADAVKNATKASPEYKGSKAKGSESYSPGKLAWKTMYYWRVDEVNTVNANSPWVGNVWSFTTGDFLLVDDFESYNAGANQIWYSWHDGLGYGAPGVPPYFAGNGTGAAVGDENTASYTEETIVHGGRQAMPVAYDNNKQGASKYSEVEFKLTAPRDWTEESVGELSIWFRGRAGSTGSFTEAPAGTFTMTGSGADIWNNADQFHFAYKTLTGAASIVAKVQSVENTNAWAKAGVMIRETLDAGSKHAFACVTPGNGVGSQGRDFTDNASFNTNQTGLTAPYWLKLERDAGGNFTVSHSANGTTWLPVTGATPRNIPMSSNVYIGLAVTSHDATKTCQAVFTNVTITGTVSPQWAHQDIGIASNSAEPLYVAVSNAAGQPAVVVHPDSKAAQITTWTEWVIPLSSLSAKGINLKDVDKLVLGLGTRGNMTTPGGSGRMYFDDIRLYRPRTAP